MTHDELLEKIDYHFDYGHDTTVLTQALRAVVELCNFLDKKGHCCVPVKEVIQAIEKALAL